jgi:hypothetical protein
MTKLLGAGQVRCHINFGLTVTQPLGRFFASAFRGFFGIELLRPLAAATEPAFGSDVGSSSSASICSTVGSAD